MRSAPEVMTPDQLYELTSQYHDFGEHRTGTSPDLATTDWFFARLAELGATLDRRQVGFDRYDVQASLVDADGAAIACDAIYYEFLGHFEGDGLTVATAPSSGTGNASSFDALLSERDAPMVVAIEGGPPGYVVMPNRPVGDGRRPPAVVVPDDVVDRLEGSTLTVDARLVPGICESSSAVLGDGPPVTVTTPLSGWFGCASERGSGIAIALGLASRLAETNTVTVVASSGHELDHIGLHAWLGNAARAGAVPSGPVIHVGASIAAARDGVLEPRVVLQGSESSGEWIAELSGHVARANYRVLEIDDPWPGEGRNWREHTAQVLSFTGAGTWFHTAGDTPEKATTPAALGAARDTVWNATQAFLDHVR